MDVSRTFEYALVVCSILSLLGAAAAEPPVRNYLPPSNNVAPPPSGNGGYPGSSGAGGYPGSASGGYPSASGNGNGGYAPSGAATNGDDQNEGPTEPANYEFSYQVKDDASGNDFGHSESRQGDVAKGRYYVLLPDGRMQIVEYTADENGYKPEIRYEGEATASSAAGGNNGYPSGPANNGQGGNGGYPAPSGPSSNNNNGYRY